MSSIFGFLKNILQFLKIVLVFCMLMLLLYWTKNLANLDWGWMGFVSPVLDCFIGIGSMISNGSLKLFEAVFEYKYMWALVIMIALYYIVHFLYFATEAMEEAFHEGHKLIKRIEERKFNDSLQKEQTDEQTAIKKYRIFVSTSVKKKFAHLECNVNYEEQNKLMNKFLMEKLSIAPTQYENGYLYSFSDFNSIDNVLDVFFKLLNSSAPLDYIICVQICTGNLIEEKEQLKSLIDLKFENKISMMSDTAFRYKFNKSHKYGTSQLGMFQKGNDTVEAHEFIVI